LKWTNGLLHFIPWSSTVINLAITDMALNKRHWWMSIVFFCPCYLLANLWGSLCIGKREADGSTKYGTVYGVEQWISHPFITLIVFITFALIQGLTFWLSCILIEKCKPVVDWIDEEGG